MHELNPLDPSFLSHPPLTTPLMADEAVAVVTNAALLQEFAQSALLPVRARVQTAAMDRRRIDLGRDTTSTNESPAGACASLQDHIDQLCSTSESTERARGGEGCALVRVAMYVDGDGARPFAEIVVVESSPDSAEGNNGPRPLLIGVELSRVVDATVLSSSRSAAAMTRAVLLDMCTSLYGVEFGPVEVTSRDGGAACAVMAVHRCHGPSANAFLCQRSFNGIAAWDLSDACMAGLTSAMVSLSALRLDEGPLGASEATPPVRRGAASSSVLMSLRPRQRFIHSLSVCGIIVDHMRSGARYAQKLAKWYDSLQQPSGDEPVNSPLDERAGFIAGGALRPSSVKYPNILVSRA